jgi:hypothetical protein
VALDDKLKPVANAIAVLIPTSEDSRSERYKIAFTDSDGHFLFRGITPGDYRIFVWETLEPNAYFDPELIKRFQPKSNFFSISESERRDFQVTAIPTEP